MKEFMNEVMNEVKAVTWDDVKAAMVVGAYAVVIGVVVCVMG